MIIDSMELNGGSSMFLEMLLGLRKYYPECEVTPMVVSKTGFYGREDRTDDDLMESYGATVPSIDYDQFDAQKSKICKNSIVVHHRLGCTRALEVPAPYVVINHTVQSPHRMEQYVHADVIVSVCDFIRRLTRKHCRSKVILNGVDNEYIKKIKPAELKGKFNTGRCHRLAGSKFNKKSLVVLEGLEVSKHRHYLIGPTDYGSKAFAKFKKTEYLGPIFNRQRKMSIIKALDVYFYDADMQEGASIAILEALAAGVPVFCRPRGGNVELVINKVNGFHFTKYSEVKKLLMKFAKKRDKLEELKKKVQQDFDSRLHIRHMLAKYMKIFRRFQ